MQPSYARSIRDWEDKVMERYSLQFRDRTVQSVLQRGQSKFVQLSLEPGEGLTKHRASLTLTVIVLTGQIRFTADERAEVLDASDMLALAPGVEHAVEAIEKSTVLLVLTPDNEPSTKSEPAVSQMLEHENACGSARF
jgi:quercetin dioxygenase-like cupin family protein